MTKWYINNKKDNYNLLNKYENLTSLQKRILANRDVVDEIEVYSFINPGLDGLNDPYDFVDMEKAINRIVSSFESGEKIRIVGDYDQDGVASTVILMKGLGYFHPNISYVIPNRLEDGYGINKDIIDEALKDDISLIITCDNGIAANETIAYANEKKIDVIVTDHHNPQYVDGLETCPNCLIINPKMEREKYPFKELCGAGVAFKLVEALFLAIGEDPKYLYDLLQFAALGTICDMVDLIGENRLIVIEGLKVLNKRTNKGLDALLSANSWSKEVTAYTVGFIIGPCINSTGRLFTARLGVELFLEENEDNIEAYTYELVSLNNERKAMTKKFFEEIDSNLDKNSDIIIEYNKNIHESICGLVAGRLKEKYQKPALIFTDSSDEHIIKGSGRSVDGFDMFEELSKYKSLYTAFGGHKMACGLSLNIENYSKLKSYLLKAAEGKEFEKKIDIDVPYPIDRINGALIEEIEYLKPFGKRMEKPLFADKDVNIARLEMIGKNSDVMRLSLEKNRVQIKAIMFKAEEYYAYLEEKFGPDLALSIKGEKNNNNIDLVYYPEWNEFGGYKKMQLMIRDLR